MSQTVQAKILDVDEVDIPGVSENVEEFDKMADRDGACHDKAVAQVLAHGVYGGIRSKVLESYCGKFNAERRAEREADTTKEDGTVTPGKLIKWLETEKVAINRIKAENDVDEATHAAFVRDAAQHDDCKFENFCKKRERGEGVTRVAKLYREIAASIIENGAADAVAADLSETLGRVVKTTDAEGNPLEGEALLLSLAKAVSDNEARERAEKTQKYIAKATGQA